jgi:hypothetical protein
LSEIPDDPTLSKRERGERWAIFAGMPMLFGGGLGMLVARSSTPLLFAVEIAGLALVTYAASREVRRRNKPFKDWLAHRRSLPPVEDDPAIGMATTIDGKAIRLDTARLQGAPRRAPDR